MPRKLELGARAMLQSAPSAEEQFLSEEFGEKVRACLERAAQTALRALHERGLSGYGFVDRKVIEIPLSEFPAGSVLARPEMTSRHGALPWCWFIAGASGAGKTTLVNAGELLNLLGGIPFFKKVEGPAHYFELMDEPEPAGDVNVRLVEMTVRQCLLEGQSFAVGGVFGNDRYKPWVEEIAAKGFKIGMIYVAVSSPDLAVERLRVRTAGGDIPKKRRPDEKFRERWLRSLDTLPWFAARVDRVIVLSNDDPRHTVLVASGVGGRIVVLEPDAYPEVSKRLRQVRSDRRYRFVGPLRAISRLFSRRR